MTATQPSEQAAHGGEGRRLVVWLRRLRQRQSTLSTLIPLVLLWIALTIASPHFLTFDNAVNVLLNAAPLALIAGGMTLTLIAAEIDLSVGSVVALVGSLAALLSVNFGAPWPLVLLGAIAAGAVVGVINGWFTTRLGMPSFVATLAMLGIARGVALLITQGKPIYGLPDAIAWLGQGELWIVPVPVVLAALILAALHFALSRTRFGLNVYAVGGNPEAARLSGVDVPGVKMAVLVLSAVLASVGGLILAARLNAGSGTVGADLLLDAIAAVVIGGTSLLGGVGRVTGTVLGVLLIASIRNGLVLLNVSAFWQQVAIGALILLAVSVDYLAKGRPKP
ncbi:MAG TPA: ABC transporter permease [Actinomycetes bacterium]|nr:ABC transporter permease [Actinomycetes bacterium]